MDEENEKRIGSRREMPVTDFPPFPRDLLQRFTPAISNSHYQTLDAGFSGDRDEEEEGEGGEEEEGGVKLSLGLSLGGRFGTDRSSNPNKLKRSSSIAGTMPIFRENKSLDAAAVVKEPPDGATYTARDSTPTAAHRETGLMRTASLPAVATQEEWKKRKEMQSLRRKEAKRRRNEKQRNHGNVDKSGRGMPKWSAGVNKSCILQRTQERSSLDSHGGGGSGGGSSSSVSDFDSSKCVQGSNNSIDARIPVANQPSVGNALRRFNSVDMNLQAKEEEEEQEDDSMPCVFTRGEGPDGRRVDGILYRYGRGEEIRIMCVCHGSFLSPAEFVKHAGGRDVDHPLRHIVVNGPSAAAAAAAAALLL